MEFERGQVYFLREDSSFGSELATGRPVVVVSSQNHLDGLPTLIAVSLSHTPRYWSSVVKVKIGRKYSYAICNQIKTLDKGRFNEKEFICKLTDEEMAQVDEALKDVLELDTNSICECEVPVVEPESIEVAESKEDRIAELEMELAIQKKLYNKAIEMLADLRFEKDTSVKVEEPKRELSEEEILSAIDKLDAPVAKKKKGGRPPKRKDGESVSYKAKREDILKYAKKSGKANVNTDEWYEIAATTGMGLQTAQNIVAYRNKHGKFKDLVELLDVTRFGSDMFDKYGRMLEV